VITKQGRFVDLNSDADLRRATIARAHSGTAADLSTSGRAGNDANWKLRAAIAIRKFSPALPWLIAVIGITLRISQYSYDRSLFLDEAFVATSIAERSAAELLQPLQFDQRAPAGFLVCVKATTLWLGRSDLVLRLVPLISGILSVVAFLFVSRKLLPPAAATFALFLFAISQPLVFLSSDLKQYSTDALMSLAILWASIPAAKSGLSPRRVVVLGLTGAAALWFSFPAVFVLAGVGLTLCMPAVRDRNWLELARLSIVSAVWGVGFVALWWLQLRFFESEPGWKVLWNDAFMPLIPRSLGDILWYPRRFFHIVTNPVGLSFPGLAGLACLAGGVATWRKSRSQAALLMAPIAVALLASGFRIYPVSGRSIIFISPLVLLLIAAGIERIRQSVVQPGIAWMWIFVAVAICFDSAEAAKSHIVNRHLYKNTTFWDYKFEEMKPLMAHIRQHWQARDLVYLYSQSHVAFEYYADQYGFTPADSVRGMQSGMLNPRWEEIEADLAKLSGRNRVWLVFTHNWTMNDVSERKLYTHFLDKLGRRLDKLEFALPVDAAVYLYDLSEPGGGNTPGPSQGLAAGVTPADGAPSR
jgi:hypothetical protein